MDIKNAFLHGSLGRNLYRVTFKAFCLEFGLVRRLWKFLYRQVISKGLVSINLAMVMRVVTMSGYGSVIDYLVLYQKMVSQRILLIICVDNIVINGVGKVQMLRNFMRSKFQPRVWDNCDISWGLKFHNLSVFLYL